MGVVTRAHKRRLEEQQSISRLPDDVLGHIVSLLPTKDGPRTQVLNSRWRPLWRSAPLNVELLGPRSWNLPISRILSAHPGPSRRFSVVDCTVYAPTLDGWFRSPALDGLQELEFHSSEENLRWGLMPPHLPASTRRFASTLVVASFGRCAFFPAEDGNHHHHYPLLKKLTLSAVTISEASLHGVLAGCPVLESFLLVNNQGLTRVKIASPNLRSIGVGSRRGSLSLRLQQLVVEDAPCLERLLIFQDGHIGNLCAKAGYSRGTPWRLPHASIWP